MSRKQTSPIVLLAGVGILVMGVFYAAQGLSTVDARIAELPIQGQATPKAEPANAVAPAPVVDRARALHPLLVESKKKAVGLPVTEGAPDVTRFDTLFERKTPEEEKKKQAAEAPKEELPAAPPPPPPTDYFKLLPQALKVQAVTGEGAIINGKFFAKGEAIPEFAYPKMGSNVLISPVVGDSEGDAVTIREPSSGRTFRARVQ